MDAALPKDGRRDRRKLKTWICKHENKTAFGSSLITG